jgi:hypothetical protein
MVKKRCQKGKSCGATCISRAKVCLMDLGSPANSILKVRDGIRMYSPPSEPVKRNVEPEKKEKIIFSGKNLVVNGEEFTPGRTLPGSTSPKLYVDKEGKGKWVVKTGGAEGQNVAEKTANDVYNTLAKPLNAAGSVESRLSPDGRLVNKFIDGGKVVGDMGSLELQRSGAYDKMKGSHIADALVANWDFMGLSRDNVMVDPNGNVTRIDTGGTFNYRAQGANKAYGAIPMEMWTLRKGQGKYFWGDAKDSDYKDVWTRQVKALGANALKLRDVMNQSALPTNVKKAFSQRMGALMMAGNLVSTAKFGNQTIQQLADSGKISWSQVDGALKKAFENASSLDSSSKSWGKELKDEIIKSLGELV